MDTEVVVEVGATRENLRYWKHVLGVGTVTVEEGKCRMGTNNTEGIGGGEHGGTRFRPIRSTPDLAISFTDAF